METLAIIPARGSSKGVPRKNVRPLAGKPLIAYMIEAALQAERVNRVVVSTDDANIAETACSFGAEIILRPANISGDYSASEFALIHALEHLDLEEEYSPDLLVFLQCTSPLTQAIDIDSTIMSLLDNNADCALAVAPIHYFLWKYDQLGNASGINHDRSERLMRQQREPEYVEAGSVYVMKTAGFLAARHRFFGRTVMHVIPKENVLDIDEPSDFLLAEIAIELRNKTERFGALPDHPRALILDFDGVLTDNRVITFQDGSEAVICSRGDGMGLEILGGMGIAIIVISKERNPVVKARCDKLGIDFKQGVEDKLTVMIDWLDNKGIESSSAIYVGNDVNDIECMKAVGCPVSVCDGHSDVKAISKVVLNNRGGYGAIRELADQIRQRKET